MVGKMSVDGVNENRKYLDLREVFSYQTVFFFHIS